MWPQWGQPHMLYMLPLCLVVVVLFAMARGREKRLLSVWGSGWQERLGHDYDRWRALLRGILLAAGTLAIVVALAMPRQGFVWQDRRTEGRNILIAVDVSRSMLADDFKPSRLERAKREILDLIELLQGDRVGLVIFAGQAFTHLPLTQDYDMARTYVSSLSPTLIEDQGTDLGAAIAVALASLRKHQQRQFESRDLIIITDGEHHHRGVMSVVADAKKEGIRIFTVGVGSREGSPLRMPDGHYLRDAAGDIVISQLDEVILKTLARESGGIYVKSEAGDGDLEKIYLQGIKQRPNEHMRSHEDKVWNERFPWALALALVLWLLAFWVSPYRIRSWVQAGHERGRT